MSHRASSLPCTCTRTAAHASPTKSKTPRSHGSSNNSTLYNRHTTKTHRHRHRHRHRHNDGFYDELLGGSGRPRGARGSAAGAGSHGGGVRFNSRCAHLRGDLAYTVALLRGAPARGSPGAHLTGAPRVLCLRGCSCSSFVPCDDPFLAKKRSRARSGTRCRASCSWCWCQHEAAHSCSFCRSRPRRLGACAEQRGRRPERPLGRPTSSSCAA